MKKSTTEDSRTNTFAEKGANSQILKSLSVRLLSFAFLTPSPSLRLVVVVLINVRREMGVARAHCVEVEAVVGWLPDPDGDVVRAIVFDVVRNSDKLKESVADVEGECPFLRFFTGCHELV